MKIINVEDGKEIVYVQNKDLLRLKDLKRPLPVDVVSAISIVNENNLLEFVSFKSEEAINLFIGSDWILNYREAMLLSESEIKIIGNKLAAEINRISTVYYELEPEEQKNEEDLVSLYFFKKHKLEDLANVLKIKKGLLSLKLPERPDYYNNILQGFENRDYYLVMGFNPNQFFIYRKDKKPFQEKENLPASLIDSAILAVVASNCEDILTLEDVESSSSISLDHTYYMTEVNIESAKKKEKEIKKYYSYIQKKATY